LRSNSHEQWLTEQSHALFVEIVLDLSTAGLVEPSQSNESLEAVGSEVQVVVRGVHGCDNTVAVVELFVGDVAVSFPCAVEVFVNEVL
jgi:hypothetical protein